jgi:AMP deaminase
MAGKLSLVGEPQSESARSISSPQTIGANGTSGALSQGQFSGSNSPKIVPGRPTHLDATPEDEDYRQAQDNDEEESDETWNRQYGQASATLPEAALGMDEAAGTTPPETKEGMLPRDVQEKTAYYDYTSEKQLSQADAKLFYQRSKLESQKSGEASWATPQWGTRQNSPHESPVLVPNSMGNVLEREQAGIKSSGSMASIQSGRNVPRR